MDVYYNFLRAKNWVVFSKTPSVPKSRPFDGDFENATPHLSEFLTEFDADFCVFFPNLQNDVLGFLTE